MKIYTVQRTVVYTVDVDAESEDAALKFIDGMTGAAFDTEELVDETIVSVAETVS